MIIGIPKDTKEFESRVAIAPDAVKKLIKSGYEIRLQSEAGKDVVLKKKYFPQILS